MQVLLTQEVSNIIIDNGLSNYITEFSKLLVNKVKHSDYGNAVQYLYIGVICVAPEFEFFFKVRKPKFYKTKTIIQDGRSYELIETLTFDVKLNYAQIVQADKSELYDIH
jgi:uncharacterized protein involved in tolerance to divalent cations